MACAASPARATLPFWQSHSLVSQQLNSSYLQSRFPSRQSKADLKGSQRRLPLLLSSVMRDEEVGKEEREPNQPETSWKDQVVGSSAGVSCTV